MTLSLQTITILAPLVFLAALSPGPDVIYIASHAFSGNWKRGFSAWSGIFLGVCLYSCATALGLGALFTYAPVLYNVVKWAGAAYLAYLGIRFLMSSFAAEEKITLTVKDQTFSVFSLFAKGLAVNILNPKTTLFYTAFLPQFIDPSLGHVPYQLFLLGFFSVFISQTTYILYVIFFVSLGRKIKKKTAVFQQITALRSLNALCGILYLGFAVALGLWHHI